MTYHIFKESNIVPSTRTIDMRGVVDTSGPHLITFGCRTHAESTVVSNISMKCTYETPNTARRTINLPGVVDLTTTDDFLGGMWYAPVETIIDQYYPLGDGIYPEQPLGVLNLQFVLTGSPSAACRISYECVLQTFDGNASDVFHP